MELHLIRCLGSDELVAAAKPLRSMFKGPAGDSPSASTFARAALLLRTMGVFENLRVLLLLLARPMTADELAVVTKKSRYLVTRRLAGLSRVSLVERSKTQGYKLRGPRVRRLVRLVLRRLRRA